MGILQREYGITRNQALWEYSSDELQKLITELPLERIIRVGQNDTQSDMERKWLEATADFNSDILKKDRARFEERIKKIELRSKIKKENNPEKKKRLEDQLKNLEGE